MKLFLALIVTVTAVLLSSCNTTGTAGGSTSTTVSSETGGSITQTIVSSAEQIALDYFNNWIGLKGARRHSGASKQAAMTKAKVAIRQRYPDLPPAKVDEIVTQTFSQ